MWSSATWARTKWLEHQPFPLLAPRNSRPLRLKRARHILNVSLLMDVNPEGLRRYAKRPPSSQRESERARERERGGQTDRQADRQAARGRQREGEKARERERERERTPSSPAPPRPCAAGPPERGLHSLTQPTDEQRETRNPLEQGGERARARERERQADRQAATDRERER